MLKIPELYFKYTNTTRIRVFAGWDRCGETQPMSVNVGFRSSTQPTYFVFLRKTYAVADRLTCQLHSREGNIVMFGARSIRKLTTHKGVSDRVYKGFW